MGDSTLEDLTDGLEKEQGCSEFACNCELVNEERTSNDRPKRIGKKKLTIGNLFVDNRCIVAYNTK